MMGKKLIKIILGIACGAILSAAILIGCSTDAGPEDSRDADRAAVTQVMPERAGGEAGGEHSGRGESGGEHGGGGEGAEGSGEGSEGGREGAEGSESGGEEGSANMLAPDETFDKARSGARLILDYDAQANAFKGTVENTTNDVLTRVRIEVHLSNGAELGPTTPIDMTAGQVTMIDLPSTQASFTGWVAHAEVGGGEAGGEHRTTAAGGEGGAEAGEAAMSSPITPLDQAWNGVLGGLEITARYDAATQSVQATVQNTLLQTLCYVQAEPHLKAGTTTVGELGPDKLGDLSPGQIAYSNLSVAGEPGMAGVAFDGYVVHMEVFECGGPGPVPHTGGEGGEGGAEGNREGSEAGGEHGSRGEGTGEHGERGGEGSGGEHGGRGEGQGGS